MIRPRDTGNLGSGAPACDEQVSVSSGGDVFLFGGCNLSDGIQLPHGSDPNGSTCWTCHAQNLNGIGIGIGVGVGTGTSTASALEVSPR